MSDDQRAGKDQVRMALRDASWWNRPDVYSPKVYHVVLSPPYIAACNTTTGLLSSSTEVPVAAVSPGMRCRRRACRNRWEQQIGRDRQADTTLVQQHGLSDGPDRPRTCADQRNENEHSDGLTQAATTRTIPRPTARPTRPLRA